MNGISVIEEAAAAHVALSPLRARLLEHLEEEASATELAERLGLTRQRVGYHLKLLERHGLIHVVDERRKRGFVEKVYRRRGTLILDPELAHTDHPLAARDRASAEAVVAAAADVVRSVGQLSTEAAAQGAALVTAAATAEITFASPSDLKSFLGEFADLAARYDAGRSQAGARHRVTLISHPAIERH